MLERPSMLMRRQGWPVAAFSAALVAGTALFRLPSLLDPEVLSSDSAVVGLQGWHLARGELSWRLWGTDYQGVLESWLFALVDHLAPSRPALGLALEALAGHLVLVLSLFAVLRRAVEPRLALLAALTLVACPLPLHHLTHAPPRIWSLALVCLGLFFGDRMTDAASRRGIALWGFLAGAAVALGYYSDQFALLLLPGAALFLGLSVLERERAGRLAGVLALVAGFGAFSVLRYAGGLHPPGATELTFEPFREQWSLLWDQCFPQVLNLQIFRAPGRWRPPTEPRAWGFALSVAGSVCFGLLVLAGSTFGLLRKCPPRARRAALTGAAWTGACLVLFLFTRRAYDAAGARYLSPILLGFPLLAASALAWRAQARWLLGVVALHFAVSSWAMQTGYRLVPPRGGAGEAEKALVAELRREGVRAAFADYWIAYRLSFLSREELTVAPFTDDRYPSYRAQVLAAERVAFLFSPEAGWEPARWEARSAHRRLEVAGYTVLIVDRPPLLSAELSAEPAALQLAPGGVGELRVRLTNTGLDVWSESSTAIGHRWIDQDGEPLASALERQSLTERAQPGESITATVRVQAPPRPGRYTLELGLMDASEVSVDPGRPRLEVRTLVGQER